MSTVKAYDMGAPRPYAPRNAYNLGMGLPQERNSQVIGPSAAAPSGAGAGGVPINAWSQYNDAMNGRDDFMQGDNTFEKWAQRTYNAPGFSMQNWLPDLMGQLRQGAAIPQPTSTSTGGFAPQQTSEQAQQQASLQNAYNTQQMGGYTGGVINSAYATPQTGNPFQVNDPSAPGVGMPWNQPWGQPGYGGPTGGTPTGGYGGVPTNGFGAGTSPQGSGWGGVFSNKNPWATS
jgi:hypothetical protein